MIEKKLGKIRKFKIGMGGYQNAMLGVTIDLGADGWGVGDFKGDWLHALSDKQNEEIRKAALAETMIWIGQLLTDAKVEDCKDLIGKPVEITFEDVTMKSWRLLTEVL